MLRKLIFIIFVFSITFCLAQDEVGSFEFDGSTRNYEVYLPHNFQANMPLVLALHGYDETIKWFKDYTLFHEYADTSGFILVYPKGSIASNGKPGWNAGLRNHPFGQQDTTSNDVGFLSVLIDTLNSHYDIDLNRVYCCGYSMGGEMTYRMAIEKGELFAAYASVAGNLNDISANLGTPFKSTPILHFHGTDDKVETYYGVNGSNSWTVEETINYFLNNNNCSYQSDTILIPNLNPNDGSTVQKISYTNCSDENNVIFFKITNGGHGWPGSTEGIYDLGNPNRDINASSIILNFFNGKDAPPADFAYGKSIHSLCNYMPKEGDTLKIMADIVNPENHSVSVYAIINGDETNFKDSIQLFDNGLDVDSVADDNIFGGQKMYSSLQEDIFEITLQTTDIDKSFPYSLPNHAFFTSAGPIVWKDYDITQQNDSLYSMKVTLENQGLSYTVQGVSAQISTNDSNIINIAPTMNPQYYPDIEPGQSVQNNGTYGYVFYAKNDPDIVNFTLDIYSDKIHFWTDSMSVDLVTDIKDELLNLPKEFALLQNYPNPFNPSTKIQYTIPIISVIADTVKQSAEITSVTSFPRNDNMNVTLKVYDILGREIATLVNEKQKPGNYEVAWDGLSASGGQVPSGVYFYQLISNDFVETMKMILLR